MMLAIAVPVLVIHSILVILMFLSLEHRGKKDLEARAVHLTESLAGRFDSNLCTVAQVARSTAEFLTLNPDTSEETLYEMLEANVRQNELIYGSCIAFKPFAFDPERKLIAPYVYRNGETTARLDVAEQAYDYTSPIWEWYRLPRDLGESVWTEPFFDEGAGDILMCTHSVPFFRDGAFRGVATVDIPLTELQHRSGVVDLQRESIFILSRIGAFVTAFDEALIKHKTVFEIADEHDRPELRAIGRNMVQGRSGVERISSLVGDEPTWLVYSPIPSSSWSLAIMLPESRATEFLRGQYLRAAIGLTAAMLVILLCIWLVSAHLTGPIRRLAIAARRVGRGELNHPPVRLTTRDELSELAETFNRMVHDLKAHVEQLTQETAAREAVESELRVAREIQSSLLPHANPPFPDRREFELDAVNVPARQIAGDFFDYYLLDHQTLVLLIADVSGKGIPAALFMAVARTVFRNLVHEGFSPAEVMTRANRLLYDDNTGSMFVTVFLAYYDIASGRITYANAGHHSPLLVTRRGSINRFGEATGTILGIIPNLVYEQMHDVIEPDERLVLYTDGVTEARNSESGMFGVERLVETIESHLHCSPDQLCGEISNTVATYEQPARQDDVTVMVLQRNT